MLAQGDALNSSQHPCQGGPVGGNGGGGQMFDIMQMYQEVCQIRYRGMQGIQVAGPTPVAEGAPMRLV